LTKITIITVVIRWGHMWLQEDFEGKKAE
jgi:hypothetical protein